MKPEISQLKMGGKYHLHSQKKSGEAVRLCPNGHKIKDKLKYEGQCNLYCYKCKKYYRLHEFHTVSRIVI